MNDPELQELVEKALTEGYEVVQQGRITAPPKKGRTFGDRAEGFMISMLGSYSAPTYKSQYENLLYDTDERWVHLRRPRAHG
jgi:hypothetical protein